MLTSTAITKFYTKAKWKHKTVPYAKIALPSSDVIYFEKAQNIISLEAQVNYTKIHFTDNRQLLIRKPIGELEKLFISYPTFIRVHRSFIINTYYVLKYTKGKCNYVFLENNQTISVPLSYRSRFELFVQECQ